MKEQLKAIIQKEAERRHPKEYKPESGTLMGDIGYLSYMYGLEQQDKQDQFLSDHQWLIDAIPDPADGQGEDKYKEALEEIQGHLPAKPKLAITATIKDIVETALNEPPKQ